MTASRMRPHPRTWALGPTVGPRIEQTEEQDESYSQTPNPPLERLLGASTPQLRGYPEYQLESARERIEEEIAANLFVRGAWREMRGKAG